MSTLPGRLSRSLLDFRRGASLSDDERRILEDAVSDVREFGARQIVTPRGVTLNESTFLLEGLMSRHVDGRDGTRQLVAIQVPGDGVDLHAYPLKSLDHDIGTLTAARVAVISHHALADVQQKYPELARKLWFLTLTDAAMHRQWVFRLGHLRAIQRVAHFLCEMSLRLMATDRSNGARFELPLTQNDVAEVCGLTSIHVNRVMRDLRERELCTFRGGLVEVLDLKAFSELAEFDPAYMYFDDALLDRFWHCASQTASTPAAHPR